MWTSPFPTGQSEPQSCRFSQTGGESPIPGGAQSSGWGPGRAQPILLSPSLTARACSSGHGGLPTSLSPGSLPRCPAHQHWLLRYRLCWTRGLTLRTSVPLCGLPGGGGNTPRVTRGRFLPPFEPQLPHREAEFRFPLTHPPTHHFLPLPPENSLSHPPSLGLPTQAPRDGGPTSRQGWGWSRPLTSPAPGQGCAFLHEVDRTQSSQLAPTPASLTGPVCFCWVAFSEPQVPHLRNGSPTVSGKAWDRMCMSLLPGEKSSKGALHLAHLCPDTESGRVVVRAWGQ